MKPRRVRLQDRECRRYPNHTSQTSPRLDSEEISNAISKGNFRFMKYLEYKGYTGSIEYSPDDNLLYGKVLGIRGLISFEGEKGKHLEEDFRAAIDNYLTDCKKERKTPEKLAIDQGLKSIAEGKVHTQESVMQTTKEKYPNLFK